MLLKIACLLLKMACLLLKTLTIALSKVDIDALQGAAADGAAYVKLEALLIYVQEAKRSQEDAVGAEAAREGPHSRGGSSSSAKVRSFVAALDGVGDTLDGYSAFSPHGLRAFEALLCGGVRRGEFGFARRFLTEVLLAPTTTTTAATTSAGAGAGVRTAALLSYLAALADADADSLAMAQQAERRSAAAEELAEGLAARSGAVGAAAAAAEARSLQRTMLRMLLADADRAQAEAALAQGVCGRSGKALLLDALEDEYESSADQGAPNRLLRGGGGGAMLLSATSEQQLPRLRTVAAARVLLRRYAVALGAALEEQPCSGAPLPPPPPELERVGGWRLEQVRNAYP